MAFRVPHLGTVRPPFITALAATLLVAGGILAERAGIIALPHPSDELVAAVLPGAVVALTNEERADESLPRLAANPLLTRAAQLKADDMAANSYYAHVSPDGTIPPAWLAKVGYKYQTMGENLVIDRDSSEAAVSAWMGSPTHRDNILSANFTEIGIGVAHGQYKGRDTIYVVQMFARPAVQAPQAPSRPRAVPVEEPAPTPNAPVATAPRPAPRPIVTPTPVRTAATTSIIVRAPVPEPVIRDTLSPILQTLTTSNVLEGVPTIVASSSYIQPALAASSTVVELTPTARTTTESEVSLKARLAENVRAFGRALVDRVVGIFK